VARQRVVKVIKEGGWLSRLLALLIIALLVAIVPPLAVLLIAYLALRALQALRRRGPSQGRGWVRLRPRWPLTLARVRAAGLRRIGSINGCQLFIPEEDPTCIITLSGFTLVGSGCLYVKPADARLIDPGPLINAAMKMRRQLILAFVVDPSRHGRPRASMASLVLVRSPRRCLRVDDEQVRALVEDVERTLDGVRAVLFSQPHEVELDVLKGDELVEAEALLAGASP